MPPMPPRACFVLLRSMCSLVTPTAFLFSLFSFLPFLRPPQLSWFVVTRTANNRFSDALLKQLV